MNKKVLVFGSYVTDLCFRCDRFPVAGETVKGNSFRLGPGGKGSNQAVAAHRAGADVVFVTKLGDDDLGKTALSFYHDEGINTDRILIESNGETGAAMICVDEKTAQNQIVVYNGACGRISESDTSLIYPLVDQAAYLLTQLETNLEPVYALLKYAHDRGVITIVDPAPASKVDLNMWQYVDIVKPNETEAEFFTGVKIRSMEDAARAAKVFRELGVKCVIITMGERGCYVCNENDETYIEPANCGTVVDTTGAGDAFSGGFVAALAKGFEIISAVRYASVTAGLSITKVGTAPSMPYARQIDEFFSRQA